MAAERQSFAERAAETLIAALEAGTAPWQRPWQPGTGSALPYNPISGKRYRGINTLMLMAAGRTDQRWMTYKQAQETGAQVRKGERGMPVQYWQFTERQARVDDQGRPVIDSTSGKPIMDDVRLERPRVFHATVFNAEQIDGLPPLAPPLPPSWDPIERAEGILSASGADIRHVNGNSAFYSPGRDFIQMPERGQFPNPANYYATALHELGHWTGHASRLDRDLAHPFGSPGYAREELRAEIASMILGNEIGIGHDPGQHAAYVKSWIKALREDPTEIFRAAADAEQIFGYVVGLEQRQEQTLTQSDPAQVEAARVAEVRERQEAQAKNPAATAEDAAAIRTERHDVEAQATRAVEQAGAVRREQDAAREHQVDDQAQRQFIAVPYREKDDAKKLGAKWDRGNQSWYIPPGVDPAKFARWGAAPPKAAVPHSARPVAPQPAQRPAQQATQGRTYLAVPYAERSEAKKLGAKWDKAAQSWYALPGADLSQFVRWKPENVERQQAPAMTPEQEFAEVLRSLNLVVDGTKHPIMDGQRHRIQAADDKAGEQTGFYRAYLDGHPAGYAKNHRTGQEIRWKSQGFHISAEEKAQLAAEAAATQQRRAAEQEQQYEAVATATYERLTKLAPVPPGQQTPYLAKKQVHASAGVWRDGDMTVIPANDAEGRLWSAQTIGDPKLGGGSVKSFTKGGRKAGCFHVLGGLSTLAQAPAIIIAEGYATAASLRDGAGFPTVVAFDAGNMPEVAKALAAKYPDKPIILAADADSIDRQGRPVTVGRDKANEAAEAVGGSVILPIFRNPSPIDPGVKPPTDFNDAANEDEFGRESVSRQVRAAVEQAVARHKERTQSVKQSEQQDGSKKRTLESAGVGPGQRLRRGA